MSTQGFWRIRGERRHGGEIKKAGATTVQYSRSFSPQRLEKVDTWMVAHIGYTHRPKELDQGHELQSDGRFKDAVAAFERVAHSKHPASPWGAFFAANARRIRADVREDGWDEAVAAYEGYLKKHPDDFYGAPARMGLGLARLGLQAPKQAEEAFRELIDGRYGPVWALQGKLGLGRLALSQNGRPSRWFEDALAASRSTRFATEVEHLARVGLVETDVRRGRYRRALEQANEPEGKGDVPAVYSARWLESIAAAPLLNTIGLAMVGMQPGVVGATAAVPFHLRVIRYYADHHAEHARALRHLVTCFRATGQKAYAAEMEGVLRARYAEAPLASTRKTPGGSLGD